jgi:hypothetical protein
MNYKKQFEARKMQGKDATTIDHKRWTAQTDLPSGGPEELNDLLLFTTYPETLIKEKRKANKKKQRLGLRCSHQMAEVYILQKRKKRSSGITILSQWNQMNSMIKRKMHGGHKILVLFHKRMDNPF